MTWRIKVEDDYFHYIITNDSFEFDAYSREHAEWLCDTLNDYENIKQKMDSLSRSVLCDNSGKC